MGKAVWLWIGFMIGRHLFRRKALHGKELLERLREVGAL